MYPVLFAFHQVPRIFGLTFWNVGASQGSDSKSDLAQGLATHLTLPRKPNVPCAALSQQPWCKARRCCKSRMCDATQVRRTRSRSLPREDLSSASHLWPHLLERGCVARVGSTLNPAHWLTTHLTLPRKPDVPCAPCLSNPGARRDAIAKSGRVAQPRCDALVKDYFRVEVHQVWGTF